MNYRDHDLDIIHVTRLNTFMKFVDSNDFNKSYEFFKNLNYKTKKILINVFCKKRNPIIKKIINLTAIDRTEKARWLAIRYATDIKLLEQNFYSEHNYFFEYADNKKFKNTKMLKDIAMRSTFEYPQINAISKINNDSDLIDIVKKNRKRTVVYLALKKIQNLTVLKKLLDLKDYKLYGDPSYSSFLEKEEYEKIKKLNFKDLINLRLNEFPNSLDFIC